MKHPSIRRILKPSILRRKKPPAEEREAEHVIVIKPRPAYKPTISDAYDYVALLLFRGVAEKLVRVFNLDTSIEKAGMNIYPVLYASRLLLTVFIVGLAVTSLSAMFILISGHIIVKVLAVVLAMVVPTMVFAIGLSYPSMQAASRAAGVENELPFFAAYLATMVRGGVPVAKVIEMISKLKIFKAMKEECARIKRDMIVFGKDPLSAIEALAVRHPSRKLRDFLLGYAATVRTGGDVIHYLEVKTSEIFASRMTEIRQLAERMSMYTEAYVVVAVILTLGFYILFTVSGILPTGGTLGLVQLVLFSFVALPVITAIILMAIHSSQPKTPIKIKRPYRALMLSAPLGVVVFLLVGLGTGSIQAIIAGRITREAVIAINVALTAGLITLSLPPAILHSKELKGMRGLNQALASFLRDLAETRKTGLSPERSIIVLASRDYGPLTPILQKIATALSWGLPLQECLRRALRGVKSWLLLTIMRFLNDAIEVGGGSPSTIDALARFTHNIVELDQELRTRLRAYIFMPYFGAILVAVSTLLVMSFTTKSLGITGFLEKAPVPPPVLALVLTISILANAWLMGLVAGKIGEMYLSGGFRHAIVITLITLACIVATMIIAPPF